MKRLRGIWLLPAIVALLVATGSGSAQAKIIGLGENQTGSAKSFAFTAKAGHINTPDGSSLLFWGFADTSSGKVQFPGPTLIVKQGDTVTINLTNQLAEPVSMLFPGMTMTSSVKPVMPAGDRSQLTSLAPEAAPGGTQSYTFVADRPGTFYYQSGSNLPVQLRMGLYGAIIVRPSQDGSTRSVNISSHNLNDPLNPGFAATSWPFTKFVYNDSLADPVAENVSTGYDREYLFLVSEMDPRFNSWMEFEKDKVARPFDFSKWKANYWFINGRCAPDTMSPVNASYLPSQPYNSAPLMHPGETVLLRFINMGSDPHPFHTHGNHMRVVGEDGNPLSSSPAAGADLSWQAFTLTLQPGKTYDATFTWSGEKLGWDIYGHAGALEPYEYIPDHGKTYTPNRPAVAGVAQTPAPPQALPVLLPTIEEGIFGMWYSGSPYMGAAGPLPPGEGGMNPFSGFFYMWHSHAERELTNYNIWPGGLLTMMGIVPWSATISSDDTYNQGM